MRSRTPLLLLVVAAIKPFFVAASDFPYEPITNLDESAYIGRWYQAYASKSVLYTFQLGGNCVTADYYTTDKARTVRVKNIVRPFGSIMEPGTFFGDIANSCLALTVNGFLTQSADVDGQGYVDIQRAPLPFGIGTPNINDVSYQAPGNYWIIALGPKENGQYQWAMVTDSSQVQLYILVRDVDEFEELYADEVLQLAKKWGFTSATNSPVKSNQENCGYEEVNEDEDDDDSKDSKDSKDRYLLPSDANLRQRRLFNQDGTLIVNGGPSASFTLNQIGADTSTTTQIYQLLPNPLDTGTEVTCTMACTSATSPKIYLRVCVLFSV